MVANDSLRIDYPGSIIHHFDLHSMAFGCATNLILSEDATALDAVGCDMRVSGYYAEAEKAIQNPESFRFSPSGPMGSASVLGVAVFDGRKYSGLKNVTMTITFRPRLSEQQVAGFWVIDTVKYTLYNITS